MDTQDYRQYWQQQITDWQGSDLSGSAFCRERGLTYHRFTYWRKQLTQTQRPQEESTCGFARVVSAQDADVDVELTVSLPGGVSISGLHAGNIGLLGAIVRQL